MRLRTRPGDRGSSSGGVLKAHTVVWGAGLQANPIATELGSALQHGNRIAVEPDLSLCGHPEVFPVGDIAWITDTKTNDVLPQLGSVVLQAGQHAGEDIARLINRIPTEPFRYLDKGTMATNGHGAAVIQMPRGRTLESGVASNAGRGCPPPPRRNYVRKRPHLQV